MSTAKKTAETVPTAPAVASPVYAEIPPSAAGRPATPNPYLPHVEDLARRLNERIAKGEPATSGVAIVTTVTSEDQIRPVCNRLRAAAAVHGVTVRISVLGTEIKYWAVPRMPGRGKGKDKTDA